jgi:hypothetical protein
MNQDTLHAPPELRRVVEAEQYKDGGARVDPGIRAALRSIDPELDLLRVRLDAAPEILPPGAVPGRWHVRNRGAKPLPTFTPIETPEGGYREPDSGVLRELIRRDMRNREVRRMTFERSGRQKKQAERAKNLQTEQRQDELRADLKAGWRVAGRIKRDDGTLVKRKVA